VRTDPARIGVSIGITIYPADGATAEQLLHNADTVLYMAKASGRDTWCAYASEDGEREHQRMLLEQDFRTAVELRQFTLAYQPICDSATREPVGFEALLRWNHPSRGPIFPAEFIPVAEQTGLQRGRCLGHAAAYFREPVAGAIPRPRSAWLHPGGPVANRIAANPAAS
jgi:predicted signal transduction protein with EAL and GGDEF domain